MKNFASIFLIIMLEISLNDILSDIDDVKNYVLKLIHECYDLGISVGCNSSIYEKILL